MVIDNIIGRIKKSEQEAKDIIESAKKEAEEIVDKASVQAKSIVKEAQQEKKDIILKSEKKAMKDASAKAVKSGENFAKDFEGTEKLFKESRNKAVKEIIKRVAL